MTTDGRKPDPKGTKPSRRPGTRAHGLTAVSWVTGTASALLTLLSVALVWGLADSPDSDLKVGVIVAMPFIALAAALGAIAYWTRRP